MASYVYNRVSADCDFYPSDMICLEALAALRDADADSEYGSDTTTLAGFSDQLGAATLTEMIDEAAAFWVDGIANAAGDLSGDVIRGFSTSTPYEFYDGARCADAISGDGLWTYDTTTVDAGITGMNYALCLRSAYRVTALRSLAEGVYDWLMSFTSNVDYETAANVSPSDLAALSTGTFDPSLALTTYLDADAENNAEGIYQWATSGLMAEIAAARNPAGLKASKDAFCQRRFRYASGTPKDGEMDDPCLRGISGLSFQTQYLDSGSSRTDTTTKVAQLGNAFRYSPNGHGIKEYI